MQRREESIRSIPSRLSRSASFGSDPVSPGLQSSHLLTTPFVRPPPAYVAQSAASQLVTDALAPIIQGLEDRSNPNPLLRDGALFSDGALAQINSFLDHLLYKILGASRSPGLQSLRAAVEQVLRGRLGRLAAQSAEDELEELVAEGDEEEIAQEEASRAVQSMWDVDMFFRRTRLRIMVYMRLGEMEDEDEEDYLAEMENPNRDSADDDRNNEGLVSWAGAIFLTSVLEFVAEECLKVAGQAAYKRTSTKRNLQATSSPVRSPMDPRLVVMESDVDKTGIDSRLGRLWRSWKHKMRAPNQEQSRSLSGRASGLNSRQASISTMDSDAVRLRDIETPRPMTADGIERRSLQNVGDEPLSPNQAGGNGRGRIIDQLFAGRPAPKRPSSLLIPASLPFLATDPEASVAKTDTKPRRSRAATMPNTPSGVMARDTPIIPSEWTDAKEEQSAPPQQASEGQATDGQEKETITDSAELTGTTEVPDTPKAIQETEHTENAETAATVGTAVATAAAAAAAAAVAVGATVSGGASKDASPVKPSESVKDTQHVEETVGAEDVEDETVSELSPQTSPRKAANSRLSVRSMKPGIYDFTEDGLSQPQELARAAESTQTSPALRRDGFAEGISSIPPRKDSLPSRGSSARTSFEDITRPSSMAVPFGSTRVEPVSPNVAAAPPPIATRSPARVNRIDTASKPTKISPVNPLTSHPVSPPSAIVPSSSGSKESPKQPGQYANGHYRPANPDSPVEPQSGSSSYKSTKAAQTSAETLGERTPASNHQASNSEKDFGDLLASKEPMKYTLTPKQLQNIEQPDWSQYAEGNTQTHETAGYTVTRVRGAEATTIQENPTLAPQAPSKSSPLAVRPPSSNTKASKNGFIAREARVQTSDTADFADYIRSSGPAVARERQTNPPPVSPISNAPNSPARIVSHMGSENAPFIPSARRYLAAAPPPVPSKNPKSHLQPRDARVDSRRNKELIEFLREGPAGAPLPTAPRMIQNRSGFATPDPPLANRSSSFVTQPGGAPSNSNGAYVGSKSLPSRQVERPIAYTNGSPSPAPQPPITGKTQYRNKDPYALPSDDEDESMDLEPYPKPARGRARGGEESLVDFLRNVEPPRDPSKPTMSTTSSNGDSRTFWRKNKAVA